MLNCNALCNYITTLLNLQKVITQDKSIVSKEGTLVGDIKVIVYRCVRKDFLPLLHSSNVVYGTRMGLTADACMNSSCTSGGGRSSLAWRYFSMEDWQEAIKAAIENKIVSIAFRDFPEVLETRISLHGAKFPRPLWRMGLLVRHRALSPRRKIRQQGCLLHQLAEAGNQAGNASMPADSPRPRARVKSIAARRTHMRYREEYNRIPDGLSRDDMRRVARECIKTRARVCPCPPYSIPMR